MSEERAPYDAGEQPHRPSVFHVEKSGRNLTEGGFPFCVITETGDVRGIFCTEAEAGIFADAMNLKVKK